MADTEGVVHVPETPDAVAPAEKTIPELEAEQLAEWGAWKATGPIYVEGVRAFNKGDAVPVSHVKQYAYDTQGLVEKT